MHYLYPKNSRKMGAHQDSSHNNYEDKLEQKFSMLFDADNCRFFNELGAFCIIKNTK